jgi:CBS domain-containing protein
MLVRDAMTPVAVTVGPDHTLRDAARAMATRRVGAAVVNDPDGPGVGIVTERDVLTALADGADPDVETVAAHLTAELVFAAPTWSLDQAAEAMVRGGFRHLVVLDAGEVAGVLAMRDLVRAWTAQRAAQLPDPATARV